MLVATELLLSALAAWRPTQVLAGTSSAPRAVLSANRPPQGALYYGFPFDDHGHYDERPAPPPRAGALVASIGDSFSLGVVPRPFHYSAVCERELAALAAPGAPPVEVYNMGLPSIDPPDYLELLVHEALPLAPDLVVVQLFAGNDLLSVRLTRTALPERWLARENVVAWRTVERTWRLLQERRARAGDDPRGGEPRALTTQAEAEREFPWVGDPALEQPSFSPETFARIEGVRARGLAWPDEDFAELLPWIERLVAAAGPTPIVFTLIPDELQVEDDVWELARAHLRGLGVDVDRLVRDRPQQVLVPWFERRGIPLLDLLPVLRAVEPLADGRRHLYHLRDTHWNARGNAVAGEALARFVREHLGR